MYEHLDKGDLWQFGFDGGHFKRVKGGREWHGPCPWCGGKDRMIVSNGKFWCRQCNKGGSLMSLLKEPPSPEEMKRLQEISERKARIQAERDAKEKEAKLKEFNRAKPWVKFHENLLNRVDILQLLEEDGITMQAVERFGLGFVPMFRYWVDEGGEKNVPKEGPGIVFPIWNGRRMHNLRIRLLEITEGDKYRPFLTGVGAGFFRADFPDEDWVVIVEGEKKAIVCWLNGIPAIGIQGCWTFHEDWIPWFKQRYKNIYLALDPDQANLKSELRLAELLGASVIHLSGKPDDVLNSGEVTVPQFVRLLATSLYEGGKCGRSAGTGLLAP